MKHVFISYDRADVSFADDLTRRLEGAGLKVWKDTGSLRAGQDWRAKIDEAIKAASALVVVMTPDAKASEYVSYEWACGLGAGVQLIPVMLRPVEMPQRLAAMHYLDFHDPDHRSWETFLETVRQASTARSATSTPIPADAPPLVAKAVEALDSLDPDESARAIQLLGRVDHPSARDALAYAVTHPNREVRIQAGLELCRFKDVRALPGLIEAQRYWQLRWDFVRRVVSLGPAVLPGLIQAMTDPNDEMREYVAHALGDLKLEAAVPALQTALQDKAEAVRDAAVKALEKIQGAEPCL